jgi:hypothetical protein
VVCMSIDFVRTGVVFRYYSTYVYVYNQ